MINLGFIDNSVEFNKVGLTVSRDFNSLAFLYLSKANELVHFDDRDRAYLQYLSNELALALFAKKSANGVLKVLSGLYSDPKLVKKVMNKVEYLDLTFTYSFNYTSVTLGCRYDLSKIVSAKMKLFVILTETYLLVKDCLDQSSSHQGLYKSVSATAKTLTDFYTQLEYK